MCGAIKDLIPPLTKEEIQKYYSSPITPNEEVKEVKEEEKEVKEGQEVKEEVKEEEKEEEEQEVKEEEQEQKEEEQEEQEVKEEQTEEQKEQTQEPQVETITEEEAKQGDAARLEAPLTPNAFTGSDKGMLFYRYRTPNKKEISRVALDYPRMTSDEYTQPVLPKAVLEQILPPDMKKTEEMIAMQNEVYERKGFPLFMPIYVPVVVPVIQEVKKEEPKKNGEENREALRIDSTWMKVIGVVFSMLLFFTYLLIFITDFLTLCVC